MNWSESIEDRRSIWLCSIIGTHKITIDVFKCPHDAISVWFLRSHPPPFLDCQVWLLTVKFLTFCLSTFLNFWNFDFWLSSFCVEIFDCPIFFSDFWLSNFILDSHTFLGYIKLFFFLYHEEHVVEYDSKVWENDTIGVNCMENPFVDNVERRRRRFLTSSLLSYRTKHKCSDVSYLLETFRGPR